MNTIIFLDLEETIIESWDNPLLINSGKIGNFLHCAGVTEIGIFSFAIWNEADKQHFHNHIKEPIERALGVSIVRVPSVEDITKEIFWKTGTLFSVHETITVWGKSRSFVDFATVSFKDARVTLIDDVVRNTTIEEHDLNLTIELINVNSLKITQCN